MKNAIQPYLHFDENCKEAMEFYHQLFGGELDVMQIGESPAKDQFPEELHVQVMHAHLSNESFHIMASDMCGQGALKQGNSVQLNLNCSSEKEINHLYNELAKGGKILSELKAEFWGALFAMVIDRFGVRWMLSLDKK
ncbi:MAG: VOC family protein [Vicingaceae bacterium]